MSLSKNKEFCFCPGCKDQNREDCKLAKYCRSECQSSHFVDHMQFCAMNEGELLKAKGFKIYDWFQWAKLYEEQKELVTQFCLNMDKSIMNLITTISMKITSFCNFPLVPPDTHLLGNMDQIVMFCDA